MKLAENRIIVDADMLRETLLRAYGLFGAKYIVAPGLADAVAKGIIGGSETTP